MGNLAVISDCGCIGRSQSCGSTLSLHKVLVGTHAKVSTS